MARPVKAAPIVRTRRADQAEQTRHRILTAASELFTEPGYAAATIEAIATRADVAVETVYSRFRNKANLLDAILGPAIVGSDDGTGLLDRPEFEEIRVVTDQSRQLRMLAHMSCTILQRTHQIHRILRMAAASDPKAAELQHADRDRRFQAQSSYIEMLVANGPLRTGLTHSEAASTYAALASPDTYAFLTDERGWTPERFEEWLRDSLSRLLLP